MFDFSYGAISSSPFQLVECVKSFKKFEGSRWSSENVVVTVGTVV